MVRISLLGTPQISWAGEALLLRRRQARALLYYLASQEQAASREYLQFLFWPETPAKTAGRNLTRLLSALRAELPHPEILRTSQATVTLDPDLCWCDAILFAQLTANDDAASWDEAVSLYRDSFLNGFFLPGSTEFDTWQSNQQYAFERRYLSTLVRLVIAKQQAGQLSEAITYAQHHLAVDDLSEEIHRHLIELYAQNGERSAALKQFEQCVLILEQELGVTPLPETRAAYEIARTGHPASEPEARPQPEWAILPSLNLPLIGRETAMEGLARVYRRFRSGGVIFITGEPGVGKSRLMQEFAASSSALVLSGNSYAEETAVPYQPLIQALRQAYALRQQWSQVLPVWLAELSRLIPELLSHLPNLPPPVDVEPQQTQARLFEALRQLFARLAVDTRLLLCLDDVHWADASTRSWLQFMTKHLAGSHICILASCRAQALATLRDWQRGLKRANLMATVALDGFQRSDVTDLLSQAAGGRPASETLAKSIHAATGGNPFFVLETIRELLATDQMVEPTFNLPLPATVRDAVLRRADRLPPLALQILEVAAVLSPLSTLATISVTAGRDEMETANSLEALILHQLLVANQERFQFQHELARQAIYQNISSWRRQLLHRRAADALARTPQDASVELPAVAAHYEAAGALSLAHDSYRQAAAAAAAIYAYREAIQHLNRAIELAEQASATPPVLRRLHETLADNLTVAGEFAAAEKAYLAALSLASEDDPLLLAQLEGKTAATLPPQQRQDEAVAAYRSALDRLDGSPPIDVYHQWLSVRLNIQLGLLDALYFQHEPEAMDALQQQTQALLDEVGTAEQRLEYFSRRHQMLSLQQRFRPSPAIIAAAREALDLARESGKDLLIARQQFHLGFQQLWYGGLAEAAELFQQALSSARTLGDSWLENQCLVYLTILYRFQDGVNQVEAYLPPLVKLSEEIGNGMYIGVGQAQAAWLHYRSEAWLPAQSQAATALTSWVGTAYPFQWLAHWPLLAIALGQHQVTDALASAREMLDTAQQQLPDEITGALDSAVSAWEAGDEPAAVVQLELALDLAAQQGYL